MTDGDKEVYITAEQAATRLKLSPRQTVRYADRITTRKAGRRLLFNAAEVDQLAEQLNIVDRPAPMPRAELVPVSEMLTHQRQQEQEIARLSYQIGRLEATITEREQRQHLLTHDLDGVRTQLTATQEERDQRRAEVERLQQRLEAAESETQRLQAEIERQRSRPWWKRLLDS
jgi:chromosome segregation ATPase